MAEVSEYLYYNIGATNSDEDGNFQSIRFNYNEQRLSPILEKPNDWEMKIQRFSIPTSAIPWIIPYLVVGSTNNSTKWEVAFNYNGVNYPTTVIYVPENDRATPSVVPVDYVNYGYYYIWSLRQFISLVNTAIATSWSIVAAIAPGAATVPPPFFIYDSVTQLCSVIYPKYFIPGQTANLSGILLNPNLQYFFGI